MSGETAVAKTGVFWDVDDCPIPDDLDPNLTYKNIKSALAKEGYSDDLELTIYTKEETWPGSEYLPGAGVTLVHKVAKHLREMIFGIQFWVLDNPPASAVLVISKDISEHLLMTIGCLLVRDYQVVVAHPDEDCPTFEVAPPSVWLWTSLSHGGSPMAPSDINTIEQNDISLSADESEIINPKQSNSAEEPLKQPDD